MIRMPAKQDIRLFLICFALILVADIATKRVMLDAIFDPPRIIAVLPFLNLAPVWNEGISFGFLASGGVWTQHGISVLAVIVSFWLFFQLPDLLKWQKIGASFIAGGAIGNAIDRQIYGRVVDFVDFHLGTWHYPAFNVADSAIFIGVCLWIASLFIDARRNKEKGES